MHAYFKQRRKKILKTITDDSVIIIATNSIKQRSGDTYYPFRPDSNFYYFTSFTEPNAVMILSKKEYIVFMLPKDKKAELWDGERLGLSEGEKKLKAKTKNINNIKEELPKIINKYDKVYFNFNNIPSNLLDILTIKPYQSIKENITKIRLIKDNLEIKNIKKACEISSNAHKKAMQNIKNCKTEYEVKSIFETEFSKNNVEHSYIPIVAGGNNANTLHYIKNNKELNKNDLILIDAGCEYNYYASDITRTYPISGNFSKPQQEIYTLVLNTQQEVLKNVKVGTTLKKLNTIAIGFLAKGLIDLGIIKDKKKIKKFYPHSIGHFLGLDVHDLGNKDEILQDNMVITIEPGIYLPKNAKIEKKYCGIGIRIEDDVLITKNGCEVLTKNCPKTIGELEQIIN